MPADVSTPSSQGAVARLIAWSARNPVLTVILALASGLWGLWGLQTVALDAIPDVSDNEVLVETGWPGRSPDLVEDAVTYPLTAELLGASGVTEVRGQSHFGTSLVTVLFDEDTDPDDARSRVLETLTRADLPDGASPRLGPDATALGWVFQYALVDRTGAHSLADLRRLQDTVLHFALLGVEGVAEVAPIGGFVEEWQVQLDPDRLLAHGVSVLQVAEAVRAANVDAGGRSIEIAGHEQVIRGRGQLSSLQDLEDTPVGVNAAGTPLLLGDLAWVSRGRRRAACSPSWTGRGSSGRWSSPVRDQRPHRHRRREGPLAAVEASLPDGVEVVTTYDRATLTRAWTPCAGPCSKRCWWWGSSWRSSCCTSAAWAARRRPAPGGAAELWPAVGPGHDRQPDVAGRHRRDHRRHGRCLHRPRRERTPTARGLGRRGGPGGGARSSSAPSSRWGRASAGADGLLPACSAQALGGAALPPPGDHQDLLHGLRGPAGRDPRPGPRRAPHAGAVGHHPLQERVEAAMRGWSGPWSGAGASCGRRHRGRGREHPPCCSSSRSSCRPSTRGTCCSCRPRRRAWGPPRPGACPVHGRRHRRHPRSRAGLRQDRPGGDGHRSGPPVHGRTTVPQAPERVAARATGSTSSPSSTRPCRSPGCPTCGGCPSRRAPRCSPPGSAAPSASPCAATPPPSSRRPRWRRATVQGIPGTQSAFAERATGGFYLDIDAPGRGRHPGSVAEIYAVVEAAIGELPTTTTLGRQPIDVTVRYARDLGSTQALGRVLVPTAGGGQVPLSQVASSASPPAAHAPQRGRPPGDHGFVDPDEVAIPDWVAQPWRIAPWTWAAWSSAGRGRSRPSSGQRPASPSSSP